MELPPHWGDSRVSSVSSRWKRSAATMIRVAAVGAVLVLGYLSSPGQRTAILGIGGAITAWFAGRAIERGRIRRGAHELAGRLARNPGASPLVKKPVNGPLADLSLAAQISAERVTTLQRELGLLQEALEGINEAVVLIGGDRRISYTNRAFTLQTEIPRARAIGMDYASLLLTNNGGPLTDWLWPNVDEAKSWTIEATWASAAAEGALLVQLTPVKDANGIRSYVAVHRDTSALQALETEQRAFASNLLRVHSVGQKVVETLDPQLLLCRVVSGIADEFGMSARLWVPSECGRHLNRAAEAGSEGSACALSVEMGSCLPGLVGVETDRLLMSAAPDDAELLAHEFTKHPTSDTHHVAYPLRKGTELLAVLEVTAKGRLTGRPLETLRLLAQVAAEAIFNAQLHQHTLRQAESLEALSNQIVEAHAVEKAHAEELTGLNENLMVADRLKTQFLNTTSHELRTPISSILGYLDLILDNHAESQEEERQFASEARQCADHLLHLINDILDVSRIEAGELAVETERVCVLSLLEDVCSAVTPLAREKNLLLEATCDEQLDATADFRRARQALLNLVANSVKFTSHGHVKLSAKTNDSGDVEISVSDTGIGIKQEDCERIFEPFFQADSGDDRSYPGTGLGLAITRRLIELMDGSVKVSSNGERQGTTFRVTLPTWKISESQVGTPVGAS